MLSCYAIHMRRKHTECDITVETYGCDLKCRFCCTGYGRRLKPKYRGVTEIYQRIMTLYNRNLPQIIRFTGGEFSLFGQEMIELACKLVDSIQVPILVETHLMHLEFYRQFRQALSAEQLRSFIFIVSLKQQNHVLEGKYAPEQVVANLRMFYRLFPDNYVAHGLIGFGDNFTGALFTYFPELKPHAQNLYLEKEGRFSFQALKVMDPAGRFLYYFDQKVKKYRILPHDAKEKEYVRSE